jgi:hypothetical protein
MIGEYALIQADLYFWQQGETRQLHTSVKSPNNGVGRSGLSQRKAGGGLRKMPDGRSLSGVGETLQNVVDLAAGERQLALCYMPERGNFVGAHGGGLLEPTARARHGATQIRHRKPITRGSYRTSALCRVPRRSGRRHAQCLGLFNRVHSESVFNLHIHYPSLSGGSAVSLSARRRTVTPPRHNCIMTPQTYRIHEEISTSAPSSACRPAVPDAP